MASRSTSREQRAGLEARIEADPSEASYAAYADSLSEHGDPRGELMRLQLVVASADQHHRENAARVADVHLAEHRDEIEPRTALRALGVELETRWEKGFWSSARLSWNEQTPDEAHLKALRVVIEHPCARFLGRVELEGVRRLFEPDVLRAALDALARAPRPVRALSLVGPGDRPATDNDHDNAQLPDRADLPDTAPIAEALGSLDELRLYIVPTALTALPPGLRALSLRRFSTRETIEALTRLDLRALETLSLHGIASRGPDDRSVLRSLLRREKLPALRALELRAFLDDVAVLLDTDIVRGLEHLDLWGAALDTDLARALATCDGLDGLKTLDLSGADIRKKDLELFQKRPFKLLRGARVWDADAD